MSSAAFSSSPALGLPPIAWSILPEWQRMDARVVLAVVVSGVIHGMALGWLPGLGGAAPEPPPLHIRLLPAVRVAPSAVPPAPTFAPTVVPEARPSRREPSPRPMPSIMTRDAVAEVGERSTVRPAEPAPAMVAPAPSVAVAPVAVAPAPAFDPQALASYGRELAGLVAARQRYPRLAQLRQWQGTATLYLELASDGRLIEARVLSSSGHEILDRQALDMVREVGALPPLPATLAGRPLSVNVPVVFRLAS